MESRQPSCLPPDHVQVLPQSRSITASECISKLTRPQPPSAWPTSLDYSLPVHLSVHTIWVSNWISKLAQLGPPGASLSSLDLGFQLHLQTRSLMASKCISKLGRLRIPSASPSSLNLRLQLPPQPRSITASKFITGSTQSRSPIASSNSLNHGRLVHVWSRSPIASPNSLHNSLQVYRWGTTQNIFSGDPWVSRHHFIFISSYHTTKIHILSCPTFGLTRSFQDFVDSHGRVVSYLLTFLCSLSWNCLISWILFGCHERCGGMLMVGTMPSISVVLP